LRILKIIVLCLALANAGYFLWARGLGGAEEAAAPAPATPTLKLASEAPGLARAAEAAGGALPGSATPAAPGDGARGLLINVKRCISVGPFGDVAEASRAASTLRGGGYDPRQRVEEGEVWAGVWVYLPLPAPRAPGDQLLTKLKAGGIDDALEMPGPNDGSVISLGLFSDPKRAQARVAQAQALGFNPAMSDRKRTGNVYWIDIDLKPTDSVLKPSDLQGESGRIVRLQVKGCPVTGGGSP